MIGLEVIGLKTIGLEMIRLEAIGLEMIELEIIGLDVIRLEMIELEMIVNPVEFTKNHFTIEIILLLVMEVTHISL